MLIIFMCSNIPNNDNCISLEIPPLAMNNGINSMTAKWVNVKCTKMKNWKHNASVAITWAKFTIIIWSACNTGDRSVGGMHICFSIRVAIKNPYNSNRVWSNCHWPKVVILFYRCQNQSNAACGECMIFEDQCCEFFN